MGIFGGGRWLLAHDTTRSRWTLIRFQLELLPQSFQIELQILHRLVTLVAILFKSLGDDTLQFCGYILNIYRQLRLWRPEDCCNDIAGRLACERSIASQHFK